uniref:Putative secreted protein n=1 Tax=Anopheles darlingi TaxID=43151 RepID=A0A2M4DBN1_ANODA
MDPFPVPISQKRSARSRFFLLLLLVALELFNQISITWVTVGRLGHFFLFGLVSDRLANFCSIFNVAKFDFV